MSIVESITIRSARESDRQQLAELIHHETHVHRHVDWRAPLDWIGREPFMVVDVDGQSIAALAFPPELPEVAWIRLFAVGRRISPTQAWLQLWPASLERLGDVSDLVIAILPLYKWLIKLVKNSGFIYTQDVTLWVHELHGLPTPPAANPGSIRLMEASDIPQARSVDDAAFERIWRNSQETLNIALSQAEIATVVEIDHSIIGYQISTSTSMGGHLARLAVLPEYWGQGIGYGLVYDMLRRFSLKATRRITVNTQSDNAASIALYSRAGFTSTGESYPVYCYRS